MMIKLTVQFRTKINHRYKDCQRQNLKPYALGNRTTMRNCMLNPVRFLYSEIHWALVPKLWLWDIINSQYVQWTMLMHMFQCFGSICDHHYYINLHDPDSTTISLLECDVWWNTQTKLKRHSTIQSLITSLLLDMVLWKECAFWVNKKTSFIAF